LNIALCVDLKFSQQCCWSSIYSELHHAGC